MNWRGEKLEENLKESRREMRICRKAVTMEERSISEACYVVATTGFEDWLTVQGVDGEGGRINDNTKIKGLATG